MKSDTTQHTQLNIRLSNEVKARLDEVRSKERPIPSLAEIVRRAIELFLSKKE